MPLKPLTRDVGMSMCSMWLSVGKFKTTFACQWSPVVAVEVGLWLSTVGIVANVEAPERLSCQCLSHLLVNKTDRGKKES